LVTNSTQAYTGTNNDGRIVDKDDDNTKCSDHIDGIIRIPLEFHGNQGKISAVEILIHRKVTV
jgi:hypothetical protein